MGKKKRIRALALCVLRHDDRILVAEGYDEVKKNYFYRPLGGGIEFGERSEEAVCRELMEEIQVEVDLKSLKHLGTVENIFSFNGAPGHEVVFIYDGTLTDPGLYEQAVIMGREANGEEIRAVWKNIHEFGEGKSILYPTGLLEMLQ